VTVNGDGCTRVVTTCWLSTPTGER
jgi:hypothetical protein